MATATQRHDEASASHITTGRPNEQMQVENTAPAEVVYPTGLKLVTAMAAVLVTTFISGLDLTIVAVVIPSLTNEFKTIEDIGWYSAAYGVFLAAFTFFSGRLYTVFSVKWTFVSSVAVFELGSLLCTVAQSSHAFIVGRAVAGIGSSGLLSGYFVIIAQCFPNSKRPIWLSIAGLGQSIGLVSAPPIGGALTDALSWRACFGINLPLGIAVIGMIAWGFEELEINPNRSLPLKEKIKQLDLFGTSLIVPSITCLLIALQWGGIKYGWGNYRIILLLGFFVILLAAFGYLQYRLQDKATLPPRILKNRSLIAGTWFSGCCNGTLAVTEYYIAIYFQGVRGYTAAKAGLLILPMIIGFGTASLMAGFGTSKLGYYTPFAIGTTILAPIASGLLTTVNLDENLVKILCLLGFLGFAIGIGASAPSCAVNTVLPMKDLAIGASVLGFGGGIGSSLFVVASAALFQNRLVAEIDKFAPGTNTTSIQRAGLSEIRNMVGSNRLRDVLLGYDEAVTQTLYLPVALTCATLVGTLLLEWRSVKTKQS